MPADAALLAAVHSGLTAAASMNYNSKSASNDVYEGYVLSVFLAAATAEGWNYDWHDRHGPQPNLLFRLGPGNIYSPNFTHAVLTKAGQPTLEAHIGVKVAGRSRVAHEFDLLVLPQAAANDARARTADPDFRQVAVHAEAKFYASNLSLHLGRGAVGLSEDCGLSGRSVLVANQRSDSVYRLMRAYNLRFRYNVVPKDHRAVRHLKWTFAHMLKRDFG